jgi:hypothetical protein
VVVVVLVIVLIQDQDLVPVLIPMDPEVREVRGLLLFNIPEELYLVHSTLQFL